MPRARTLKSALELGQPLGQISSLGMIWVTHNLPLTVRKSCEPPHPLLARTVFKLKPFRIISSPVLLLCSGIVMSSGMSSWEGWGEAWFNLGAADVDDPLVHRDTDVDWDSLGPAAASQEFASLLISLKLSNQVSATTACHLAFFASKAGMTGIVEKIGMKPGYKHTGEYSRHFDDALDLKARQKTFYQLPTCLAMKHDSGRHWVDMPIIPPHELLAEEWAKSGASLQKQCEQSVASDDLPPAFKEQCASASAPVGTLFMPIAVYCDGVAFHRGDSCIGFWIQFLHSTERHLWAVVRKSELDGSGSHGWDTLFPVWSALAWSLAAMAGGTYPLARHDESPFRHEEGQRIALRGTSLPFRAVCAVFKGDWAEYVNNVGLPSWGSLGSPCFFCRCGQSELWETDGCSPVGMPFPRKDRGDYDRACAACERHVTVNSRRDLRALVARLEFDRRDAGSRGLALVEDLSVGGVDLLKGDRLEQTVSCQDVGSLSSVSVPVTLTFWRRSLERGARRRNPVFNTSKTLLSAEHIGLDWLHLYSLGTWRVWIASFFWFLIKTGVFGQDGGSSLVGAENAVDKIRTELFAWYAAEDRAGRRPARVFSLGLSMIGPEDAPELKTYGAPTNSLVDFSGVLLRRYSALLGERDRLLWGRIIGSSQTILSLLRKKVFRFSIDEAQRFSDATIEHVRTAKMLRIPMKPKHHMMLEQSARYRACFIPPKNRR